jgi:signal transduction histidine kinase
VPADKSHAVRRYAVAILCMLVAFAIRYSLTPILGEELPFMLFIAAALVAAWYGGAASGIASLLLGLVLADHFFLPKGKQPGMSEPTEILLFFRYVFTASLGIFLIEILHRNRRNVQREVELRARSEKALRTAQAELSRHAGELEMRVAERSAELTAQVKFLQELLYQIAHNLRAPLRAMQGYSTILATEYASKLDATAQDYSRHISDATSQMNELINDVLQYGRLGHLEPRIKRVKLEEAVDQVLYLLAYQIQTRQAEVNVARPLPEVQADPDILGQVLINLIENAIKFRNLAIPLKINLRAETRDGMVRLWVEDNGIGIELRHQQRIFGAFEIVHSLPDSEGTGIGLAVVKQGMQLMGGEVGLESELGRGSRFWIELPP